MAASRSIIQFDGAWSQEEKALIKEAIASMGAVGASILSERTWHCVRHVRTGRTFYFAHWLRRPLVLSAPSAAGLAAKIKTLRSEDLDA